jgi:hypothetical protein
MSPLVRGLSLVTLVLFLSVGLASQAHAQRTGGAVGLGGQAGDPSGITLKVYNANSPSYDVLAAWSSIDDFFFLNGHALFENTIPAENVEQPLEWFIGPGAFIGAFEQGRDGDDDLALGISGTTGIQILLDRRFEIYLQATPRFFLVPETDANIGGGLGFRYYF